MKLKLLTLFILLGLVLSACGQVPASRRRGESEDGRPHHP